MVAIFGPSINTSQGMYSINPTATLKEVGPFALLTEYRMTLGPRRPNGLLMPLAKNVVFWH